jgi:hypothetical protein
VSHSIPVFIFLLSGSEIPSPLASWRDASDLIGDRWDRWQQKGDTGDFMVSTSRNWWHQHLLYLLCQACDVHGLEFAAREISSLAGEELQAAALGLEELLRMLAARRIPEGGALLEPYADILGPQLAAALDRAQAQAEIEQQDAGFEAAVSFFSFLKSLRAMLRAASQQDKSLLFVMVDFDDVNGPFRPDTR